MIRELGPRRWIAWKLVQLAHRIIDTTWYERILITDSAGETVLWFEIEANEYGAGVTSAYGVGPHDFTELGPYTVAWDDCTPEWLDE